MFAFENVKLQAKSDINRMIQDGDDREEPIRDVADKYDVDEYDVEDLIDD